MEIKAPINRVRVVMWLSYLLASGFAAGIVVALILPYLFEGFQLTFIILCAMFILIFTTSGTFSINYISGQKRFLKQIMVENTYSLGKPITFFNLDAFKIQVRKVAKRRRYAGMKQYLVAFTPTALDVASNRTRNDILMNLNYRLATFLDNIFTGDKTNEFDPKYNIYAFSRGVFLMYCFCNDDSYIHRLINVISNECFRMVNEDKIKIWVQPFYGIHNVQEDDSIIAAIENALIARERSEKNYESFTYFRDSFKSDESSASNEIAQALANDEFVPFYQPKYSLKDKAFTSVEVLARWQSPKYGLVGPGRFIEKAEHAGLLSAIDIRIFEKAVKDLSDTLKRGRRVLPVSVNFSLYEFFSKNFLNTIISTLKQYQVPAKYLEIEITETTSQVNKFLSLSVIRKLKEVGVRVLMDDFGIGYSQIDTLRQIPFDAIKIDKSFVDKMIDNDKTRAIIKFLIELGHTNDMEVIAEGVETKDQVDILRKFKIDTIQGFYYSRPIPIDKLFEFLKQNPFEKGVN